jgi:hypothetical protein
MVIAMKRFMLLILCQSITRYLFISNFLSLAEFVIFPIYDIVIRETSLVISAEKRKDNII